MKQRRNYFWIRAAAVAALVVTTAGPLRAGDNRTSHRLNRLDARLRAVVAEDGSAPARVIIRVRPGTRAVVREALAAHGDQILWEHGLLDALQALVHSLVFS